MKQLRIQVYHEICNLVKETCTTLNVRNILTKKDAKGHNINIMHI